MGQLRCGRHPDVSHESRPAMILYPDQWLRTLFHWLAAPVLALIGGLALACFVKVFGVSFLGEPRSPMADQAHEAPGTMLWPMGLLMFACIWIGLLPTTVRPLLERAAIDWTGFDAVPLLTGDMAPLGAISLAGWALISLLLVVGWWVQRRSIHASRDIGTWGCGYLFPSSRMQYSASSFADSLVRMFRSCLRSERHGGSVRDLFPGHAEFSSHTPDLILDRTLTPTFICLAGFFSRVRRLFQNGFVTFYLLYIALTLVVLLTLLSR